MRVVLEQLFYGRGPQGYAVLGLTPGAEAFQSDAEAFCEAIGTPVERSVTPFLASRPCRGSVMMVQVVRGEPDSCGRETVLYHVLIGRAQDLAEAHIDAFALAGRGLFQDKVSPQLEQLEVVDGEPHGNFAALGFKVDFPAVIVSGKPEPELVRSLLGSAVLDRSWATFAFHAMPGFDLYVLGDEALRPTDVACYDSKGMLMSRPSKGRSEPGESKSSHGKDKEGTHSTMLKISLLANAILILVCVMFWMRRPAVAPKPVVDSRTEALAQENKQLEVENKRLRSEAKRLQQALDEKGKAPDKGTVRTDVIRQFKNEFEGSYHGKKQSESLLQNIGPKYQEAFRPYLRFVNERILEPSNP